MTQVTINLSKRYAAAFGTLAATNKPNAATVKKNSNGYSFDFYAQNKTDFENIVFKFQSKTLEFGSIPFINNSSNAHVLAPPPLVSFSRQKKHIITDINGGEDEVVERWNTRQYEIRMRGLLIDLENHQYPENKVTELNQFFEYNGVVAVSGTQFFDKSISNMYLKGFEITGVQGFEDTLQYTITAKAIKAVSFTLLNPNQ